MKIYLVRHGLTNTNKEKRYVGWGDARLSPDGYRQAECLGRKFARLPVTGLYCSDLSRTLDTALPIGKVSGLEPAPTPLLREINFGQWEGLTYQDMTEENRDTLWQWIDNPFRFAPPGGESLEEVFQRAWSFLEPFWANGDSQDTLVVVSHGGVIRSILHRLLKLEPEKLWDLSVENASISLLQRNGSDIEVAYVNDCSHLDDDASSAGEQQARAGK